MVRLVILATMPLMAASQQASVSVSAVVRPAGRLELRSAGTATVSVTLNRNTRAWVWLDIDSCDAPREVREIGASGVHQVAFTASETEGKKRMCLASSDGAIRVWSALPPVR